MGMDIWAESGIIASPSDMIGLLRKKDVKQVRQVIQSFLKDKEHKDWKKGQETLGHVDDKTPLENICDALDSLVVTHGEPTKYGSDECYVEDSYEIGELWCSILSETRPELPGLRELTIFDSGRLNGGDVPLGEPCFIFEDSGCFTQQITDEGRALKKALGHRSLEKSEWTIMSV